MVGHSEPWAELLRRLQPRGPDADTPH